MRWLGLLCRLAVGGVFVFASLDKLAHPDGFALAVSHYRMVPMPLLHLFASLLPMLELVAGAALILGFRVRGAALLTFLMTVMFIVAIAAALFRGLDISCGCFNTDGGHGVGMDLLLRDLVLLALCLPPLLLRDSGPGFDRLQGSRIRN
jgi:uncharacterized membrane protein YphA (DoxX/SURF4 family)